MGQSVCFFLAAVLIIGALMFALICNSKRGVRHLDIERYRVKYLAIENKLKRDEHSSYYLAVLNADKLVDQALKEYGLKGQTMAERMKNFNSSFSDRNGIWLAHKLRNKIAHESDTNVSYDEARRALASFKRALRDLGAI